MAYASVPAHHAAHIKRKAVIVLVFVKAQYEAASSSLPDPPVL